MLGAAPLAALAKVAEAAADVAGAVIRPLFRAELTAELKGDASPVTIADRAAEQAMRAVLSERTPEAAIMGEEFGTDRAGASLCWVLDPIDGTRAFITGRPIFGTLIALLDEGVPVLGIIDQPVTGERWVGIAGEKTRFRGPAGRAGVRRRASLAEAELSCTSPEMLGAELPRFQRLAGAVRRVTWGGDCYGFGLLALGQIDIVAECDLKIWDWAALGPVVEGAGGLLRDWSGRKLTLDSAGDAIAVGDPSLLEPAIAHLKA